MFESWGVIYNHIVMTIKYVAEFVQKQNEREKTQSQDDQLHVRINYFEWRRIL